MVNITINSSFNQLNKHILNQSRRDFKSCIVKKVCSLYWFKQIYLFQVFQSFLEVYSAKQTGLRNCHIKQIKPSEKLVGKWLIGCGGMVYLAVVLGGITRLTESGLSMVTWKLLGEKRPQTDAEWKEEFKKYQEYPEFKM